MAQTGKKIVEMFDEAIQTYEEENNILPLVNFIEPDGAELQVAGDVIWRSVQQHRPVISGWDVSAQNNDIIQEAYPAILGTPANDSIQQRADELRNPNFLKEAARVSGKRQAAALNSAIITAAVNQGAMFYRSAVTSGYDFIGEAKALMDERQGAMGSRYFLLNNRDAFSFAKDLAARQTLQGRPEKVWVNGQIGQNIAGFDVYESASLPNLDGGANPAAVVVGNQSFKPLPGTVVSTNATGVVTNNDYRYALVAVPSAGFTVGDKVTFANAGTTVKALNLLDKTVTDTAMTFTIVAIPAGGATVGIYPKPIALNDAALSVTEVAYANVDTQILNGATMNRVNIDTSNRANLFWSKEAIEVIGGTLPDALMKQYAGWQIVSSTMKNGLRMYMLYDGNIDTAQFRFRLFTWYGVTIANPSAVGVAVTV